MSDLPSKRHLDTTNPDHIIYQYDMIKIEIMGGVRTDILDRMKVTLKVTVEHLSIRHTFDLYNSHQVEKFTRMVASTRKVL